MIPEQKNLDRHALKGIDTSVKVFEPLMDRFEGRRGRRNGAGSVLVGHKSELANLVRSLGAPRSRTR